MGILSTYMQNLSDSPTYDEDSLNIKIDIEKVEYVEPAKSVTVDSRLPLPSTPSTHGSGSLQNQLSSATYSHLDNRAEDVTKLFTYITDGGNTLDHYTDSLFIPVNYRNNDGNTSPVTMSESNSNASSDISDDDDDDSQSETEQNDIKNGRIIKNVQYKRLKFGDVEKSLSKYYDKENKYSNELDILITYLNGQKHLYIHSQNATRFKLNALTVPCLIMSAAITIFAPFVQQFYWSAGFISALNAIIALLISLINYWKLEASAEIYLHIANQYDKLETSLEVASNKLLFFENEIDQDKMVLNKVKDFENQLNEIKKSSTLSVPSEVKRTFPLISYINIFSFIKKMELYKKNLIVQFKDVKNEIRYILYKWTRESYNKSFVHTDSAASYHSLPHSLPQSVDPFEGNRRPRIGSKVADLESVTHVKDSITTSKLDYKKEKKRLEFLYETKDKIKNDLIHYKNAYGYIDELFTREIKNAESNKNSWMFCFSTEIKKTKFEKCNPVIDKYLNFVFVE